MRFIRRYLVPRLIQWVAVTVLGITIVFVLPRLMPVGPVEKAVAQIQSRGQFLDPEAAEETIRVLREMYGLEEGLVQQYISFWRRLFSGDFGPSLVSFPVPVTKLIAPVPTLDVRVAPHHHGVGLYHREYIRRSCRVLYRE